MYRENNYIDEYAADIHIISKIIATRSEISQEELESLHLLKRMNTKYILHISQLNDFLTGISNDFSILRINENNIFTYENIYFDTDDFYFYKQHHNKIRNRYKLRIRNYIETNSSFLEIKNKNNKQITKKDRLQIEYCQEEMNEPELAFLRKHLPIEPLLIKKVLRLTYNRITFAKKQTSEKITVDFNLRYGTSDRINLSKLVIIEHKTEKIKSSDFINLNFKSLGAIQMNFSKYCFGLFLTNHQIKINRFKERYLYLLKIINPRNYYGYNINLGNQYQFGVFRFHNKISN